MFLLKPASRPASMTILSRSSAHSRGWARYLPVCSLLRTTPQVVKQIVDWTVLGSVDICCILTPSKRVDLGLCSKWDGVPQGILWAACKSRPLCPPERLTQCDMRSAD